MTLKNAVVPVAVLVVLGALVYALLYAAPKEPEEEAKIDVNAACEGALVYMSFPDGASADVFVAECKEGKHPEVIDRYKADMNLESGVAL